MGARPPLEAVLSPAHGPLRVWRWVLTWAIWGSCLATHHPASARDIDTADKRWTICWGTNWGDCELLGPEPVQQQGLTPTEADVLAKLVGLTAQKPLSDRAIVRALGSPDIEKEPEDGERFMMWFDQQDGADVPSIRLVLDRKTPVQARYQVPGKFTAVWYNPDDVASRNSSRKAVSDQAYEGFRALSARFNRELAGRYPFGTRQSLDASLSTVRAFFADYALQAAPIKAGLAMFNRPGRAQMLHFLAELDQAAAFLGSCLSADEAGQPMVVKPRFRMRPGASPGSDQLVSWTLHAGPQVVRHPNPAASSLNWSCGQGVMLELQWASASAWRPVMPDDDEALNYRADGLTATFAASGDWALLRLIEAHRTLKGLTARQKAERLVMLEFSVPTQRLASKGDHLGQHTKCNKHTKHPRHAHAARARARLYLGLSLSTVAPHTGAPKSLTWPGNWVRVAPQP